MIRSLWTAASGMQAQQLNIDNIANNLANVNTAGFKKSRVNFQDLMYETIKEAGTPNAQGSISPNGIEIGNGVRPASVQRLFTQGNFQQTGNPLDLVIEGDGFFQIQLPDGSTAYTRDGSFKQDGDGRIVTSDGYPLFPEIYIPEDAVGININADGTVSVMLAGEEEPQEIGQLELARFANPAGLSSSGRNLFKATVASGAPIIGNPGMEGFGTIAQGYLEMSNVQVVEEMVNMITAQRAYEINSKTIQASEEMLRTVSNLKR
ncbi:flagellar basal body rod protein FlgG [Anoxybacter fermentans]|uniref:Flagellar basal-body rod protein FlgG n=1 Tax=Anoxybacter fermentans TaxID=1323375 RepID=A0A3Q9HRE6_9FIRM|nr:flagellar basal-body rod protein FlgG [Anoxybacter fermentans]AZR73850.1 flagellar basal body rod protein FlgG [Anoxybacter fermentans]